ncbi:MAG: NAD-dependent epimerase/dehydratase family protein, partial [Candidatus Diapherotrites archaeon]|nr:NAD-dependent epimerase/dehydratase family protein [Candidatus Diapherotrites archaeon]
EALLWEYENNQNAKIRIARIFNTYGPKLDPLDGRVVPTQLEQALNNKPITVFGTGLQTRSFCYVSDLVRGLHLLMNSNYSKPVNLGNPNETTIVELAKLIKDLTHSNSKIVFTALPDDDPQKRLPDISTAKKELNWSSVVHLKAGLEKTISWFKRN